VGAGSSGGLPWILTACMPGCSCLQTAGMVERKVRKVSVHHMATVAFHASGALCGVSYHIVCCVYDFCDVLPPKLGGVYVPAASWLLVCRHLPGHSHCSTPILLPALKPCILTGELLASPALNRWACTLAGATVQAGISGALEPPRRKYANKSVLQATKRLYTGSMNPARRAGAVAPQLALFLTLSSALLSAASATVVSQPCRDWGVVRGSPARGWPATLRPRHRGALSRVGIGMGRPCQAAPPPTWFHWCK